MWFIPLIAGLSGMFIGSQVDNAVQAKFDQPAVNQNQPSFMTQVVIGLAVLIIVFLLAKKIIK